MSYLYVSESGASINFQENYFVVTYRDGMIKKIPSEKLESVIIFGNINITTPCTQQLLERGISVTYFSTKGKYFGRLESTSHINIFRQKKQIFLSEDQEFCLAFSKQIIDAKIRNQLVVLNRYTKSQEAEVVNEIIQIKNCIKKLPACNTKSELMGYEGTASRSYFSGIAKVIHPDFKFSGRSKRPPKDAFNSMLSLGYTLILYEIYGVLQNRGLNPYAGFLHSDREQHPTLVSDMMEEWRPVLIDSLVLSLIQGNEIKPEHFMQDEESQGVFLTKDGMKIFIKKLENKLRTETKYLSYVENKNSFRTAIYLQAGELIKAVENGDVSFYKPIIIR